MSSWWFDQAEDTRTEDQIAAAAAKQYEQALERQQRREEEREQLRQRFASTRQVVDMAIMDAARGDEGSVTFGWPTIDAALTRPIRPGEVVLLAARTGIGKTWIAQHLVEYKLSTDPLMRALVFNLEMSHEQMGVRIGAHALGVSPRSFDESAYRGELSADAVVDRAAHMDRAIWYAEPASADDLIRMHGEAVDVCEAHIGMIVVDYLGLVSWRGGRASLYERASENARALKEVAKATSAVVLAAVQLSRAGGRDGNAEPSLDALRDSGATEEAADRVLMFWRGDDEQRGIGDKVQVRAKVAKNRHGGLTRFHAVLEYDEALRLREVSESELYAVTPDRELSASDAALAAQDDMPY